MMNKMVQPVLRCCVLSLLVLTSALAQTPSDLFEKEIRPTLAEKCYGCHSSKLKSPMGGLVLDTKAGMKAGGNGGPVMVPGDPKASRLLQRPRLQRYGASNAAHGQAAR